MDKCVICDVQTMKYKCPKCFSRYCSVSCCKAHKVKCSETPDSDSVSTQASLAIAQTNVPHYPLWSAETTSNRFPKDVLEDDTLDSVSTQRLDLLRGSKEISDMLSNPHLRAMCENLVNTENPSLEITKAMQEPIFVEMADECLRIVDSDNPHLETCVSPMDDL